MDTHAKVAMKKALVCLTMASLAIVAVSVPVQAASNLKKVFNSLPAQLPGNVPSVGFEATQTDEFGDSDPPRSRRAEAQEGYGRDELVGV